VSAVTYMQRVTEDVRLVLLRLLAESPAYTSNSSILDSALEDYGHHVSRDQVHTELTWLSEQGLVQIEPISTVLRATLTARGLDVARGQASVPGVRKRPPGA
jgi:Fe2+ or Zn2+ uptake regulation protein